ncbi:TIGR03086 family protein [Nonomuraea terrae]|uniref:TIGR03086 family protein n=1 Tax=Nonomuraea terrae TaxID=2530383 RepID=A0A4R4YQ30_9ACTN|nr:TIGR03086 family metal-binding protein [Nonomuraea terrae]TDD47223.1 TIGR03086 family protein [Nonomuraea terrae]
MAGALVRSVTPARLDDPAPCAGWNVRALLDHLTYETLMWAGLARGAPRTDHDADHLGSDHVGAFQAAAAATLAEFRRPGMLEERYGPAPGWRLVEQVVVETLVHGWDLAGAIGASTDLAPQLAEAMEPALRTLYDDLPRTPGGSFAPEQEPPPGATHADRLAAPGAFRLLRRRTRMNV